jgi:hypothetical protein
MLFGTSSVEPYIGVDRTLRQIATALWIFLVPAWFSLEAEVWEPENEAQRVQFLMGQRTALHFWTVVGGALAIIIGAKL